MQSRASTRPSASAARGFAAAAAGLLLLAARPPGAPAQELPTEWSCFESWTVSYIRKSDPFTVDRAPWGLRWRRTTPTHTEHDGLFAELYRVEDGEKTEDQVAAVNTDHEGHEGAVMVRETGTFWLDMESWSDRTEWTVEACFPAEPRGADRSPS